MEPNDEQQRLLDAMERLANVDHAAYDRMMHERFQEENAALLRDQQAYTASHQESSGEPPR